MTIFETEEKNIQRVQALLDDEQQQGNPLMPELGDMLKQYKRLYKQLRHVISLSDRQQLRLNELNRQLSDSNASKDKFFSIIAHDLRGPLSSLIGLSEVMQEQIREDAPKTMLENSCDSIYSSTKNLYTLLENLLTWSQIQRGIIRYKPEQLDLAEICKFALRIFHAPARQKQLQLINEVAQDLLVEADYNMLSTVLRNLISNAIKFTPSGGKIILSARDYGEDSIKLSVSDSGIGVPSGDLDKLFRLDRSYSGTGTAGEKGTGLGLNLCKEFIEQAGQTLWIESQEGQGTRVHFTLSRCAENTVLPPEQDQKAGSVQHDFSRYRMLVVDDVPANRQSLIDFLRPFGFRFREAGNAQEAFGIWKQWRPQIVWMDIRMPVMDGYAGARQIRASDNDGKTALIALSASIPEEEYPHVMEAGYDSLLRKPFHEVEVLATIEQYLDLKLDMQDDGTLPQETPATKNPELTPEDFVGLPEEVLKRLKYIAIVFDMNASHKLIDELRPQNSKLAEGLDELLKHFDFARLDELLEQSKAL